MYEFIKVQFLLKNWPTLSFFKQLCLLFFIIIIIIELDNVNNIKF